MPKKTAAIFASKFKKIIDTELSSQKDPNCRSYRWIAKQAQVDSSTLSKLCKTGHGSEEAICRVLLYWGYKKRSIRELLADRRSELTKGKAKEVWSNFRYAYPNALQYMEELSKFPTNIISLCSKSGISLKDLETAYRSADIPKRAIKEFDQIHIGQFSKLIEKLSNKYSKEYIQKLLLDRKKINSTPNVIKLDTLRLENPLEYIPNHKNCTGRILYGLPHVVFGYYEFSKDGFVGFHTHRGRGVEFLYSLKGTFKLYYGRNEHEYTLENDGYSVLLYEAHKRHSFKLDKKKHGQLVMVRFTPRVRFPRPGLKYKDRKNNSRKE